MHVLVVDDERLVRDFVLTVLQRKGHTVNIAVDGQEAYELYVRQPSAVELLVTDLVMPRMSGLDLIRKVKAINSELPVIVMSGHLPDNEQSLYDIPCLLKPFAMSTLMAAVVMSMAPVPSAVR